MPTLRELGLSQIGNYLSGDRGGIRLNNTGAEYLNSLYPTPSETPNFSEANGVEVDGKLPRQESRELTAHVEVYGNGGHVSSLVIIDKDDWFLRMESDTTRS